MEGERAVALIQALFRGRRWRRRWRACVRGVTRLQARQRARYTRWEFAALRQLQREHQELADESDRRQRRIVRSEQELAFLRLTSPEDLARLRELQQRRGARLIQQTWRGTRQKGARRGAKEVADPRDRVFAFDPFAFEGSGGSPTGEKEPTMALMRPLPSTADALVAVGADTEALAARRKAIHERVRRKVKEQKARDACKSVLSGKSPPTSAKPTRRELCETLGQLRARSSRRITQYSATYRVEQRDKQLTCAQLLASCGNRLGHLRAEQPPSMDALDGVGASADVFAAMERWSDARKHAAWRQHRAVVDHALKKQHWWQTHLAGAERDIRGTFARSRWEPGQKLWTWPPRPEAGASPEDDNEPVETDEIRAFLFGEAVDAPVADDEASAWWRAHCTQSHLSFLADENNPAVGNAAGSTLDSKWTPEAVANPQLWRLMEQSKRCRRAEDIARELSLRADHMDELIARGVAEVEGKLLANTQLKEELATRAQRRQERKTREQTAAVAIQRHARGLLGRKKAREVRAEFFVMVRGRAIRKGKCEECGEQRAVLECRECQDSAHFCPVCWVHVHSTRRRKTHVALPIAAPLPVPAPKASAATNGRGSNAQSTRTPVSEGDPRPRRAVEASGRPGGVSIPRLALAAARSEPLDDAGVRGSAGAGGGEHRTVAPLGDGRVVGNGRVAGEHAALAQTEQPADAATDQQTKLRSEDATSVSNADTQQHGAAVSDAAVDTAAAVPDAAAVLVAATAVPAAACGASPRAASSATIPLDPPPASSAAVTGEHTQATAPAGETNSEDRRPPAAVRRTGSARGLNDKKRPAVKLNARPSLKERVKAATADVDVTVASAAPGGSDASNPSPPSEAPASDGLQVAAGGEGESRSLVAEQLDESGERGGRQAAHSPLADADVTKDVQEEDDGKSDSISASEAAGQQQQERQEEEGGGGA